MSRSIFGEAAIAVAVCISKTAAFHCLECDRTQVGQVMDDSDHSKVGKGQSGMSATQCGRTKEAKTSEDKKSKSSAEDTESRSLLHRKDKHWAIALCLIIAATDEVD